ncbi:MAG: c-type cytochrome biogenesis protein CcmI [Pseudolabrys sp.]
MILWFVIALMTVVTIFTVRWSLTLGHDVEAGSEFSVYREKLDEIDRDRAAGLIGEAEAEAAHVEVSRRLIAAADTAEFKHPIPIGSPLWRCRAAVIAGLVLLPISVAALYLLLGFP